jgi:hypothetical protein
MPTLNNREFTASVESSSIVLHENTSDIVFEGLIEFAKTSDDEIK